MAQGVAEGALTEAPKAHLKLRVKAVFVTLLDETRSGQTDNLVCLIDVVWGEKRTVFHSISDYFRCTTHTQRCALISCLDNQALSTRTFDVFLIFASKPGNACVPLRENPLGERIESRYPDSRKRTAIHPMLCTS